MTEPASVPSDAVEFLDSEPEPLWSFAYVSRPIVPFTDAALRRLSLTAQTLNAQHGLTGRLVVIEKDERPIRFVQCVEGPRPELAACSRRIFADARHGDIQVIQSTEITSRRFAEWSMQYETVAEASIGADVAVALWGADEARVLQMGEAVKPLEPPSAS